MYIQIISFRYELFRDSSRTAVAYEKQMIAFFVFFHFILGSFLFVFYFYMIILHDLLLFHKLIDNKVG